MRHGEGYQVRYASNHPYAPERRPYACHDEATLGALLLHFGTEAAATTQACATVRKGGVAVLRIVLSPKLIQAFFRPTTARATRQAAGESAPH